MALSVVRHLAHPLSRGRRVDIQGRDSAAAEGARGVLSALPGAAAQAARLAQEVLLGADKGAGEEKVGHGGDLLGEGRVEIELKREINVS